MNKHDNVVKNNTVKRTVYDQLLKKVKAIQVIDTSDLVKKADYSTNIDNKLTRENFAGRLKKPKLATRDDTADFVRKIYFDKKQINTNKKLFQIKQNM